MTKPKLQPVNEETFENFLGGLNLHQEILTPTKQNEEEEKGKDEKKKENVAKPNNNVLKNNEVKFSMHEILEEEDEEEEGDNKNNIIQTSGNKGNILNKGNKSVEKLEDDNILNKIVSELYEDESLIPFNDEVDGDEVKPFEVKTAKDLRDLIKANKEEWKRQVLEEEFEEEFKMLPNELQLLIDYVKKGGTDVKGVLREITLSQEIRSLDPTKDPQSLVRQYLSMTTELTDEEINEQVDEWVDLDLIEKKASTFKPKLEALREKQEKKILKDQEDFLEKQRKLANSFTSGLQTALKDKEINGLKITAEQKQDIFKALVENNHVSSINGAPLNFLGKYLEEIAWEKPNYKKLAELTFFAKDPEAYREKLKDQLREELTAEMEKKLRSNSSNLKTNTDPITGKETTTVKKTINRNGGLLRRNF